MAFDYLRDTNHIALEEKVSSLIPGEFPEFFRADGKDLVNFFKTYYKFFKLKDKNPQNSFYVMHIIKGP